ncbi:hypothetical protein [Aeromonas enteropelogenes]|uniref:hypothetical protein n=1 Tax=Aeromonas enteropelogenes TaxID=29489 RepID=UPI003BA32F3D
MDKHGLSIAICRVANAVIESLDPIQSPVQVFCIECALDSLAEVAADYGLNRLENQLQDRSHKIQRGRHARPIEEAAIS